MKNLQLKWKIVAYLLGFCALLLGMLWLFQTVFLNDMYQLIRKRELREAIGIVEKEINSPQLQSILVRLQEEKDILIAPAMEFIAPQRAQPKIRVRIGERLPETITETRAFTLENGHTLTLAFHAMILPVNATVTTLRTQLYIITAAMLLLSVLLAIIIARRVSRPIEDISRSAQTLAKGDYSTRFDGKGFREIEALSQTLNTAAAELGRVEGLRRELLANVSHDLRTPLALIYSYAEMMSDFPAEIAPEQTQLIMEEAQRLAGLVSDVLDLSKLEADMERCNAARFNLTENIQKTTQRMQALLQKEGFRITFDYDSDVYVNADENKISRAFYNLLINAVNYSGESREVVVTQKIKNGAVRISVIDHGEGILPEELPAIWDRYYKSGKQHKRGVAGTGLGLSIVKKIIELHGGRYGVQSEYGKGSVFWFEVAAAYE